MAVASGSLAYLGAARFQGYWNAYTNAATGSGYPSAPSGVLLGLFSSGTSTNPGGYSQSGGGASITASAGDYWQVTGTANPGGTNHNVDGETDWSENDWIIYSASAGATDGTWIKLAYEDTIASIVVGDISGDEVFHLTGSADKHVLFISGSSDAETVMSGSDTFTFRYATPEGASTTRLFLTGNLHIADDMKVIFGAGNDASFEYDEDGTDRLLYAGAGLRISDDTKLEFGTGGDATIEYDENGTDELRFAGAAVTFEQNVTFDNDVVLGIAQSDRVTATGRLTASQGLLIKDDKKLYFGDGEDASFEYDEDGTDTLLYSGASLRISDDIKLEFGSTGDGHIVYNEALDDFLVISGSAKGIALSGSSVNVDGKVLIASGSSHAATTMPVALLQVGEGFKSGDDVVNIAVVSSLAAQAGPSGGDSALDLVEQGTQGAGYGELGVLDLGGFIMAATTSFT